jgi:hypothetical protein
MAISHAGVAPATTTSSRARKLARWILGGTVVAALLTALTIAVWPASETDKARADGEKYGAAVADLYDATSAEEVDAAVSDMHDAAVDTRNHAGDAVSDQVNRQTDALDRAGDGYVGSRTTDDEFSADVYQAQLDVAVDDLATQADDFRSTGPEVQQAFWDGYQDGLNGN